MAVDDASAETYAEDVVISEFDAPGDDDVLQKVLADLTDKCVESSEHAVRVAMDKLMDVVRRQIMDGG